MASDGWLPMLKVLVWAALSGRQGCYPLTLLLLQFPQRSGLVPFAAAALDSWAAPQADFARDWPSNGSLLCVTSLSLPPSLPDGSNPCRQRFGMQLLPADTFSSHPGLACRLLGFNINLIILQWITYTLLWLPAVLGNQYEIHG